MDIEDAEKFLRSVRKQRDRRIAALHKAGKGPAEIARLVGGITRQRVHTILRRMNP